MRIALIVVALLTLAGMALFLLQGRGGLPSIANERSFGGNMEALPYQSDQPVTRFARAEQVIDPAKFDYFAEIETTQGKIGIDLFETEAPNTVNSFVFLALNRYFEGIVFHRVIPGFVAQTGDPTGTGTGGPGYQFGLEVNPRLNFDKKGVLGMARTMDPNSNGSQFFITFGPTPNLNQQYTVFGQVVEGMGAVESIAPTEGPQRRPDRDQIVSVKIFARGK
jgi:peptidylprolyl isomerase